MKRSRTKEIFLLFINGIKYRLKGMVGCISRYFYMEPQIENTLESLARIQTGKSVARFGDGEFNLIFGKNLGFQKADPTLSEKLLEVLLTDVENLEIGLPKVFGSLKEYEKKSARFWRAYLCDNRSRIMKLLEKSEDKTYINTNMTRFWTGYKDKSKVGRIIEEYKKIWEYKNVVFIEGELTRCGVGNDLFDNVRSLKRILCPSKDAWKSYGQIIQAITNRKWDKDTLFILALGPTATILAHDMAKLGLQALDLGHLDVQYEYFIRRAKGKIAIEGKYVNENIEGRAVSDEILDEVYNESIICRVG